MKTALITGITGQDGSYLAELLLEKGYAVHGIVRRVALEAPAQRLWRILHLLDRLTLHTASLESYASLFNAIKAIRPDECYHMASPSFVSYSFDDEFPVMEASIQATHYILSALRHNVPQCRFYFAASSELFGVATVTPQDENTPFHPRSPYGISKLAGFYLTRSYQESYGVYGCNGILFNHESPRRGFEFVTRKITTAAAGIKLGLQKELRLGNLDAQRDWGYAPDYVQAMWMMLQRDEPEDFVIGTGVTHTVRQFVQKAFEVVGLDWEPYVRMDPSVFRPSESHVLCANPAKANGRLGWRPTVTFDQLVQRMVEDDMKRLSQTV